MKVRITFDISDDQRLGIGAISWGEDPTERELRPASREEIVDFIEGIVDSRLNDVGDTYRQAMDEVVARLKF